MNHQATSRIQRIEGTVMAVNSYVVHGPDGLVVVDGQLTLADAAEVRAVIDARLAPAGRGGDHAPPSRPLRRYRHHRRG